MDRYRKAPEDIEHYRTKWDDLLDLGKEVLNLLGFALFGLVVVAFVFAFVGGGLTLLALALTHLSKASQVFSLAMWSLAFLLCAASVIFVFCSMAVVFRDIGKDVWNAILRRIKN